MNQITYEQLSRASETEAQELAALVPQMTKKSFEALTPERVEAILVNGTQIWVARDGQRIVGVGLLGVVEQLVGAKYWVEDLIVDSAYRGRGIANELMNLMLAAVPGDAYSITLTSKAERPEAQAWYQRLGFVHESNVYRRRPNAS